MPPPRGGVQAESVVCGDHPKNQMPRDPNHRLAHGLGITARRGKKLPGGRPKK